MVDGLTGERGAHALRLVEADSSTAEDTVTIQLQDMEERRVLE